MIHHWKGLELEIAEFGKINMIEHPQLKPYELKPQTLKHVEIIKVSDKPTYDTFMESS